MKTFGKIVAVSFLALAGTLALLLVNTDIADAGCFLFYIRDVLAALAGKEALAALLFAVLWALDSRTVFARFAWQRRDRLKLTLLATLFAFVSALGAAYRADDGSMAGFTHPWHLLLLAGKGIGFFSIYFVAMKALLMAMPLLARRLPCIEPADARAVRRTFWLAWALILLAWLPAILASYPGALSVDAGRALQQFAGEIPWTSDHPPAFTLLLGSVVWLGSRVGGDQFGLLLFTLLQSLALSGVMACSIAFLRREGFPPVARHLLNLLYALLPMAMLNAPHIIKDVPYAAAFFAYCLCAAQAFLHPAEAFCSRRWWAGLLLSSLLVLLLRHNGILAVAPMTLVLMALFLHERGMAVWPRTTLLLAPLLMLLVFNGLIVPRFAYKPESTPDVLGVAFQQTARILKNSPQDVTAQDRADIDRILEVDALADSYTPKGSDAVRKVFRYFNGHTGEDVLRFTGVWARLSAAHPLTAFHAFWSLSEGFLDPFDNHNTYVSTMPDATSAKYPHAYTFAHPEALLAIQPRWDSAAESYRALPVVSQLESIGFFTWLMFTVAYLIGRTRAKRLGWLLLPPMMTLCACLFSAGFETGSRYALPMVYTVPFLLCLLSRPILSESGARPEALKA